MFFVGVKMLTKSEKDQIHERFKESKSLLFPIQGYNEYSKKLEELVFSSTRNRAIRDKIALLTLLIETWDAGHNTFSEIDPIRLLHSLMWMITSLNRKIW
jgi:hypothetical protein